MNSGKDSHSKPAQEVEDQPLRYGMLRGSVNLFSKFPGVENSIATIAAAINKKNILPAETLCIVDLKVASIVGCPT